MPAYTAFVPANGVDSQSDSRKRWLLVGALFLWFAVAALLYSPMVEDPGYWPAIGIGTATLSLCVIALLRVFGFAWQSAPIAYIAFVWMFHFPMTLLVHLLPDLQSELPAPLSSWAQDPDWYRASIYALLCVIAFVIGCGLVSSAGKPAGGRTLGADIAKFQVGIVTAAAGLAWLYYLMYRDGGLDLFGNGYAQMYASELGSGYSVAIFITTVGCVIALLSSSRRLIWLPLLLQAAGSVPLLLTGSRQFALIGPLVLAVLAAKRGFRLGLARTAVGCVLVLWVISYVGETRNHGVMEGVLSTRSVGPVHALVEMGGSLQTTSLAFDWIQNGDRYLLGGSYWLPFERGLGLLLPLRTDLATDPRAMNMIMLSRTAGLGGSAVAESYYNFSACGAIFFLLLGYILTRFELYADSAVSGAFMGVVLYAVIFQARNWFLNVPMLIFLGLLPVLACRFVDFVARRRESGAAAELVCSPAVLPAGPQRNWHAGRPV